MQDDAFDATDSITICAFTTDPTEAPLFRLSVEPNERKASSANKCGSTPTKMPRKIKSWDPFDTADRLGNCRTGPNGLRSPSRLMVDKTTTVPKSKIGARIGRLDDEDVVRLNQAAMVFLGLAVSPRAGWKGE